jgi:hypothetical protein
VAATQPPVAAPPVAQTAGSTAAQATADDLPF